MTEVLVGTGGWSYFQISGVPSLEAYSRAFNFVEVNSTFYKIPSVKLVEQWRRRVPRDFRFAVRCHRNLTYKYRLEPVGESHKILSEMTAICRILQTTLLHIQTPKSLRLDRTKLKSIADLFSSADLGGTRIVWEIRGEKSLPKKKIIKLMKDFDMIHSIDLSKGQEPAFQADILYSRLFGKGKHNIYQPTDRELKRIHKEVAKANPKTAALSFHFVKMYKDAARFRIYNQTGRFPPVTSNTGIRSLEEVLKQDALFPTTKKELIEHQGWKLIDLTNDKRVRAVKLLQKLPKKTYNSLGDVIEMVKN
ncbi:DUF72 domain-containing protein [Candidatus Bathyarchaeota archaeon]|nr:DUF72 domain-containing protein [Candidatus Bathyarchaeota archaeon]